MRGLLIGWMLLVACGGAREDGPATQSAASDERPEECPATVAAPDPLPNIREQHRTLAYWIEQQAKYGDIDAELLSEEDIDNHNRGLLSGQDPARQPDLTTPLTAEELHEQLSERLPYIRERLENGTYLDAEGERLDAEDIVQLAVPDSPVVPTPRLHVALERISLRCAPRVEGFYTASLDLAFDRNNCSTVHPQEPIEILSEWAGGTKLARTRYALGWIAPDAELSPPVPTELRDAVLRAPRIHLSRPVDGVAEGSMVASQEGQGVIATSAGFNTQAVQGTPTRRALTRRAVLSEAFALLDEPYGWGGHEGGRDCSRFLLDVFSTFGLHLPRHSGRQALAGTFAIDVADVPSNQKALILESAMQKGVVLLHFPGHIMLYLGRDSDGRPMAIHAFSEYVTPCEGTDDGSGSPLETLHRVDRVTVSDLTLGEGSSRRDFLSRVSRVVVLGKAPGTELRGAATLRPTSPPVVPEACDDSLDVAVFRSPARPHPGVPLRVIITSTEDPGPVALTLLDPAGNAVEAEVHETGGPPFGYWAQVDRPRPGRWTAVLGDGTHIAACERFTVGRFEREIEPRAPGDPAWVPSWSWERDTENLFAVFVEQLFRDPVDEEITWNSLQEVLRDPARNILYDHRHLSEDSELELEPDCADLPYFLRAYFSWKLTLPFAWRQCSRGREGQPPACDDSPHHNLMPVDTADPLQAFKILVRQLGQNVHSSTQRTVPDTDSSDVYPVPLTREALRPGTIFADPYGHILVVAAWIPQGIDRYGILIGADAQPDGTVGRRRFWRGSFLFTPETDEAGAGFKAWRPVVYNRREEVIELVSNDELRRTREYVRFSNQQYSGTADAFYESMEEVINPRPLEPTAMQVALVDALEEGVVRRVVSVSNGEEFMASRSFRPITMPEGASIFQTEGPWEDFSTPSRDLRLLISIDAVIQFPDRVERSPERFGVRSEDVAERVAELRATLDRELAAREFQYNRSDGSPQTMTLKQVVDRRTAFEMAYNPNDCIEIRWAGDEAAMSTCRRHAPREQRQRMERYRPWFETRNRPAR